MDNNAAYVPSEDEDEADDDEDDEDDIVSPKKRCTNSTLLKAEAGLLPVCRTLCMPTAQAAEGHCWGLRQGAREKHVSFPWRHAPLQER